MPHPFRVLYIIREQNGPGGCDRALVVKQKGKRKYGKWFFCLRIPSSWHTGRKEGKVRESQSMGLLRLWILSHVAHPNRLHQNHWKWKCTKKPLTLTNQKLVVEKQWARRGKKKSVLTMASYAHKWQSKSKLLVSLEILQGLGVGPGSVIERWP